jgi:mannose-1-phosphate guanylyltransferase
MADQLPHVFAVILAGGSGTRFWPASRKLRPKQLLSLAQGEEQTLLGATVERISPLVSPESTLISTGSHLISATRAAVPDLPDGAILAEPLAKNTAPCIAWAAQVIARRDPEAKVIVLPSDQHAADAREFRRVLGLALEEADAGRIVTVGVVPTRPETGYGYIQKGPARRGDAFEVSSFKEKPDLETAGTYVESGDYLWNAGMFIFRAADMLSAVARHLPKLSAGLEELSAADPEATSAAAVARYFERAESISIDHGVMEKESALSVVAGDFGWTDLGSWESLWEFWAKDESGNAAGSEDLFIDAERNLVVDLRTERPSEKAAALVSVRDLCVVLTDDGVLVIPRSESQRVREVVRLLQSRGRDQLL